MLRNQIEEQLFCIAAGKPGGGTFLPHCFPEKKAAQGTAKVNGWGPFFANDRLVAHSMQGNNVPLLTKAGFITFTVRDT
jgi:hypothetical protein